MRESAVGGDDDEWIHVTPESMAQCYEHYRYFMDHFAPTVITVKHYLRLNHNKRPEEWLSSSGEAFALMMMENYMESARKDALGEVRTRLRGASAGRWTLVTLRGGFDPEGMARYEELYDMVCASRRDARRVEHSVRYVVETRNMKLLGHWNKLRKYTIKSKNARSGER